MAPNDKSASNALVNIEPNIASICLECKKYSAIDNKYCAACKIKIENLNTVYTRSRSKSIARDEAKYDANIAAIAPDSDPVENSEPNIATKCIECKTYIAKFNKYCAACKIKLENLNTVSTRSRSMSIVREEAMDDANTAAIVPVSDSVDNDSINKDLIISLLQDDLVKLSRVLKDTQLENEDLKNQLVQLNNREFQVPRKTFKPTIISHPTHQISTANRFTSDHRAKQTPRMNFNAGTGKSPSTSEVNRPKSSKVKVLKSQEKSEVNKNLFRRPISRRVLLLADSQGRGCNNILSKKLGPGNIIESIIKPNAPLREIVKDVINLSSDLQERDVIVISGGTNDTHLNIDNAKKEIDLALLKLLPVSHRTNIIINTIPHRFDRDDLNSQIDCMNQYLHQSVNSLKSKNSKRTMINFDVERLSRDDFTRHGLHLNNFGKGKIYDRVAMMINMIATRPNVQPTLDRWLLRNVKNPTNFRPTPTKESRISLVSNYEETSPTVNAFLDMTQT